jgi:outer membrane assembly lipoprotein YfiO
MALNLAAKEKWDDAADAWIEFLAAEQALFGEDLELFESAIRLHCRENVEKYRFEVRKALRELPEILDLLEARRIARAEKLFFRLALVKLNLPGAGRLARLIRLRGGKLREEALKGFAEARYRAGRYIDADDAYEKLLSEFPMTGYCDEIIGRQYEIGLALIRGAEVPKVFLFISFDVEDREAGREILDRLVGKYAGAEFADDAIYALGVYFFVEEEDFESAALEFKRLIKEHSKSIWRANALYMLGLSYFKQFEGIDYDPEPLELALDVLERYILEYPQGNRVDKSREYIRQIREYLALKLYAVGEFYERDGRPRSAVLSYNHVLRDYAGTRVAKEAGERHMAVTEEIKRLEILEAKKERAGKKK